MTGLERVVDLGISEVRCATVWTTCVVRRGSFGWSDPERQVGRRLWGNLESSVLHTCMMDNHNLADADTDVKGEDVVELRLRVAGDIAANKCV